MHNTGLANEEWELRRCVLAAHPELTPKSGQRVAQVRPRTAWKRFGWQRVPSAVRKKQNFPAPQDLRILRALCRSPPLRQGRVFRIAGKRMVLKTPLSGIETKRKGTKENGDA